MNASFRTHDVTASPLPRAYDLILSRDMMIHLPNRDVASALGIFAASGSRFLLATTTEVDPEEADNLNKELSGGSTYSDHHAGRDVALELPPFRLPRPVCAAFQYQETSAAGLSEPASYLGLWDMHHPAFRRRLRGLSRVAQLKA